MLLAPLSIHPVKACSCTSGHSACAEVAVGTAVFTARVLSVSPPFLNRYNAANRTQADRVNQLYEQLDSGAAGHSLQSLKDAFRDLAPGLSPDQSLRLRDADSRQALRRLLDVVLDHGSYVTLEVKTVFSAGGDDDDKPSAQPAIKKPADKKRAKDNDDDDVIAPGKLTAVWTPSFDCGVEFQVGETYLVYASMDEDSDMAETDTCMGTRRLSDAGADLPYLSFVKTDPEQSAHLEGFVTSSVQAQANPPQGDRIPAPVAGVLVELHSDAATLYTTSDNQGRFVFDGLAGGPYRIAAYAADSPDPNQRVSAPREMTILPKACARFIVLAQPKAQ